MPSARSTNNSLLDALAISLASAVVITERIVVPTLLLSLKLLEEFISRQEKPENTPMQDLEMKKQDYAYIETSATQQASPKKLEL